MLELEEFATELLILTHDQIVIGSGSWHKILNCTFKSQ